MSSIKTTQIDGNVSVGRNVAMGGNSRIAGSVMVGHNLRVEGWLDAPNIKGALKGVFTSLSSLREVYPSPEDGWLACVGVSSPFSAYISKGGEWLPTGGSVELKVDMSTYNEGLSDLRSEVEALTSEMARMEDCVHAYDKSESEDLTVGGVSLRIVSREVFEAMESFEPSVLYVVVA